MNLLIKKEPTILKLVNLALKNKNAKYSTKSKIVLPENEAQILDEFTTQTDSDLSISPVELGAINAVKRDISLTNTSHLPMNYFLNTHLVVKKLNQCGLKMSQSEAITDLLVQIMHSQAETQIRRTVTKEQLEITVQQLLAEIGSVKKDMLILEKSELSHLRHDSEKLSLSIRQLESKLSDECSKLKSGFALDVNLEKSRAKEDDHKLNSEIQTLTNRIGLEVANMRADIANLRANFEGSRTDIIKYVARTATGTIVSVCTIGFLIYRFIT